MGTQNGQSSVSSTHILAILEILENIFSYIIYYTDFVKLLKVNHIWQLEAVRAILKLYRNMFYFYNHNILNIELIRDFDSLKYNISELVYKKYIGQEMIILIYII